jgi:serine/threonine-protein kinase
MAMSGTAVRGFDAWSLLDVALIFGLSFGIYKKSRVCAVLMLAYFIVSKIVLMLEAGKPSGLLVALIFAYFYVQGIRGTVAFHKLQVR